MYNHFGFTTELLSDVVGLAKAVGHPRVGVTFVFFHWYALGRKALDAQLIDAVPYLRLLHICGTRPLDLPDGM